MPETVWSGSYENTPPAGTDHTAVDGDTFGAISTQAPLWAVTVAQTSRALITSVVLRGAGCPSPRSRRPHPP